MNLYIVKEPVQIVSDRFFLVLVASSEDAEQIEEEADDYLIQSTTLNGNPWSDYRISHQQILQGGELHFEMKATK
ncbi:glycoside hydrolase family 92 protein [Prevotella copri]|uniref:Glycoside hydrolase family 92 protein n=1 Tax=Segatella copri TaxID=165179 RepID=A0A6G1TXJ3_9BACT|nr:glycoside hydrolase family 92 protein [Segatella copri]